MASFSIALTGLKANSVALNTIGNNLANLNTTAFKKQTTNFADLFYQTIGVSGSNNPLQVGAGTRVETISTDFEQGSPSAPTGNSTDMAINGDGFFVLKQDGVQALTRTGNFQLDPSGNLITSGGMSVMGYPAVNGVVNTNASLTPINIPIGRTQASQPTSTYSIGGTLNAASPVGTSFSNSQTMYDSLGAQHAVSTQFTKTGPNTWDYQVTMPVGESTAATGNTGTLTFDSSGNLASPTGSVPGIAFTGLTNAAKDLSFTWNLHDSAGKGTITQTSAASVLGNSIQDGYASGTYKSFSVDSAGVMSALFSNGHTEAIGQVAVATVANQQGLTRAGDNAYYASQASGLMTVAAAGTAGRGGIEDNSLEGSNVDIATEFSDLIVAQRAFQANSKTVTAFDQVTQDTINMIR